MTDDDVDAARRRSNLVFGWLQSDAERFDRAVDTSDAIVVSAAEGEEPRMGPRLQLGTLEIAAVEADAVDVEPLRTARAWRGVVLGFLIEGSLTVSQEGRSLDLAPGDFVFYTSAQRYRITARGHHRFLVVRIPTANIALRYSQFSGAIALDLSHSSAAGVLRGILSALADPASRPSTAAGAHVADALVAAAHAVLADARPHGTAAVASLFTTLLSWIEEHLDDQELTAETLAAAHFLSPRYVRRIFAANGATVTGVLRQRRLERIRDELLDPRGVRVPIRVIAARWGLADPATFSRAFSRQYGQSPRRYRALHLHQGDGSGPLRVETDILLASDEPTDP